MVVKESVLNTHWWQYAAQQLIDTICVYECVYACVCVYRCTPFTHIDRTIRSGSNRLTQKRPPVCTLLTSLMIWSIIIFFIRFRISLLIFMFTSNMPQSLTLMSTPGSNFLNKKSSFRTKINDFNHYKLESLPPNDGYASLPSKKRSTMNVRTKGFPYPDGKYRHLGYFEFVQEWYRSVCARVKLVAKIQEPLQRTSGEKECPRTTSNEFL